MHLRRRGLYSENDSHIRYTNTQKLSEYEVERQNNIMVNQAFLASLCLVSEPDEFPAVADLETLTPGKLQGDV